MQFDAVVHSVFASAVNLKLDDQELLLTLLDSTQGDFPQGIRLEAPKQFSFEPLRVGMRTACREGLLRFDGHPLIVDLRDASCWDAGLPALQMDLRDAAVRAAWQCAREALDKRQSACASELRASRLLARDVADQPLWVQQAGRCMRDLLRATLRFDAEHARVIQDLVGLGPGLTPSGDDMAAGYLLGLTYAVRGRQERSGLVSHLRNSVFGALNRTGDISRTYLSYAARGEPSSAMFGLASAIRAGASVGTVRESAKVAMSLGHTSGMDAVTGLLLGAAAWDASELLGLARTSGRDAWSAGTGQDATRSQHGIGS